jgi:hypothetical protein
MRYLNERMSIDAYKRLHSAFVGSFEDLMKSRGGSPDEGADNALGYFNALLNGYGEALVNGNWINYDSKTRRNERIRQKNKAKKEISGDNVNAGDDESTLTVFDHLGDERTSEIDSEAEYISTDDENMLLSNVKRSFLRMERKYYRRYSFGLRSFLLGFINDDARSMDVARNILAFNEVTPTSGKWDTFDYEEMRDFISAVIRVLHCTVQGRAELLKYLRTVW